MRCTWNFPLSVCVVMGLVGPPVFGQAADPAAGSPTPATQPSDRLPSYIQAVQQAADPSAAVAAYARAAGQVGNGVNQGLLEAYVYRMVQFDLPEVAYHQARLLVDLNPSDGIAWGVLGFVAGRRGQMAEALTDAVQAATRQPDNLFVQRTAGELLAWYDLNKPDVSDTLRDSIEKVRSQLQSQRAFASAYQDAASDLKRQMRARPALTTQPATAQAPPQEQTETQVPSQPWPQQVYPSVSGTQMPDEYSTWYPSYPQEIVYPSMTYQAPYTAPDWCWWDTWWPYYGAFGLFGPPFPRTVVINNISQPDLFRLGHLLFERQHDRFSLVGVDFGRHGNRLGGIHAGAGQANVRGFSGQQVAARDVARLSGSGQSRIFSPGRASAQLSFGRQMTAGDLALRQRLGQTASGMRAPVAVVPDSLAPRVISPNAGQVNGVDVSRSVGLRSSGTAVNRAAARLSGSGAIAGGSPANIGPNVINPQVGQARGLTPRAYSPSVPSLGGAAPRMDVSRSIGPSYSGAMSPAPSYGGVARGAAPSNVSRGGGGGSSQGGGGGRGGGGHR